MTESEKNTVLSVSELNVCFATNGGTVNAVNGVSFDLKKGETLGIVGESGSGKSVTSLAIMRLLPKKTARVASGEIVFENANILELGDEKARELRGRRIAMIFQDPMTSLNPYRRISTQLMEITRLHLGLSKKEALDHAVTMLRRVGIPDAESRVHSYPHEFSGGMRQRVMIAMALSCDPELLIADEPTTALDVTIQAQILDLIRQLKTGTSVILITHDLGIVAGMTDSVIVMYAGRILEKASTNELFARPSHPYTRGLLRSVPSTKKGDDPLYQIPGMPPDPVNLPPGCAFAPRCEMANDICRESEPPFAEVSSGHFALCHFAADVYSASQSAKVHE